MSLVRCPNGHVYNARRYGKECPYCRMKLEEEDEKKPEGFEPPVEVLTEDVKPVCGWLVCIEGARVGMDYKIHDGKNFVIPRSWASKRSASASTWRGRATWWG